VAADLAWYRQRVKIQGIAATNMSIQSRQSERQAGQRFLKKSQPAFYLTFRTRPLVSTAAAALAFARSQ
jgi:hypothetical protein